MFQRTETRWSDKNGGSLVEHKKVGARGVVQGRGRRQRGSSITTLNFIEGRASYHTLSVCSHKTSFLAFIFLVESTAEVQTRIVGNFRGHTSDKADRARDITPPPPPPHTSV